MSTRERGGGGKRQFPVGRHRYVPVVDAGCGCRPRRPRLLLSLPSFFLKPCSSLQLGGKAATRSGGDGEQYSCASTTSTAASFSSSSAATHSSSTGYASAYSSDYYYCYPSRGRGVVYGHGADVNAKKHQDPPPLHKQQQQATTTKQLKANNNKKKNKKRHEKTATASAGAGQQQEEEDDVGVGVAVEKESSDPRADFRDSMVQMVVEMGLCDWDGLRGMLHRLLALNAPRHHAAILTAFAEVCTHLAGAAAAATTAAAAAAPPPPPQPSPPAAYQYWR